MHMPDEQTLQRYQRLKLKHYLESSRQELNAEVATEKETWARMS